MTTGHQIGGRRVVGAIPGIDRCPAEGDGQHRLSHTGWPDEEHIGGIFEEPQGGQLVDHGPIHRGLGVEVKVLDPPWCGQTTEALQTGPSSFLGRRHFDLEQASQEGRMPKLHLLGVVEFGGQGLSRGGQTQVAERTAE